MQWFENGNKAERFDGDMIEGHKFRGKVTLQSGEVVAEGDWYEGKLNGQGKAARLGYRLEGLFKNGELKSGTVTTPEGNQAKGSFQNLQLGGEGRLTMPDGATFQGQFHNGQPNGWGKKTLSNGDEFEGEFVNGNLPKGTATSKRLGVRYDGYLQDWKPNGKGIWRQNGHIADGQFKDGYLDGQGTLTFPDQSYYVGAFQGGGCTGAADRRSQGPDLQRALDERLLSTGGQDSKTF